ncbi:MAG TPA: FIST N-terminal domain-containing protein [Anaeromyxobacter sp.]|nr:FIST N-terminal domain-containing protein [Anaeromyxobacter sp.]
MSRSQNALEAGREAAAAAVAKLEGQAPAVVIVFATPCLDLSALLRGVRDVSGDAVLVGSTGTGELVQGEYVGLGQGVGVLAMTAGPYRFGAASAAHVGGALEEVGQDLARRSRAEAGKSPYAAVLLVSDQLMGDLQGLTQGVYKVGGPRVSIVGGGAGDEYRNVHSQVFHNGEVVEQGVAALWIASDTPLQVVTRHGWKPFGTPMLVTKAEGTTIHELGGRPAIPVYAEQIGRSLDELAPERFLPISAMYPLGILQSDGSRVIRLSYARVGNGLVIHGCLPPPGCAVQVMTATVDELLAVGDEVIPAALAARPDAGVVLVFSCAARGFVFGDRVGEEAPRLQKLAGNVPVFGLYTHAEFARTAGVLATHNETLTALAL